MNHGHTSGFATQTGWCCGKGFGGGFGRLFFMQRWQASVAVACNHLGVSRVVFSSPHNGQGIFLTILFYVWYHPPYPKWAEDLRC